MRRIFLDGPNQVVARIDASGVAAWYLADRQGSIRDVVNFAGTTVVDAVSYDGFGQVTAETNASAGDAYKYNGGRYDSLTGFTLFGAREYDAATGSWTTRDPSGFGGGDYNIYRYVGNSPTNATDPTGEISFNLGRALTGAAAGGATGAAGGALVGTFVLPAVGTGVGAGIFGVVGGVGGFVYGGFFSESYVGAAAGGGVVGIVPPAATTIVVSCTVYGGSAIFASLARYFPWIAGAGGAAGVGTSTTAPATNPYAPGSPLQNEITFYTGHRNFLQIALMEAMTDLETVPPGGDTFELLTQIERVEADLADLNAYISFLQSLLES
jgi:RHS repeat-associated protein